MGYGSWSMISGGGSLFGAIVMVVIIIDLALLGIWLWKQINKQ